MTAEPGKLVGGKYRLERPLAKGGMGSVWVARHTELDAPVAVKLMAGELVGTAAAEARFKREAKAAAQLRGPHVVHIHDYGVEEGAPYMVMELLEGHDLAEEIARAGRLPVARVAAIVTQVAKALALAHAAGIVHRDLKPSNLFLARSGEDEFVKVLDFGVAKETVPTLVVDRTTSGVLIGSPQYMSPEQARGEHVDLRSDLWSLGVVAFEALTGRPPFESTHLGALLAKIHEASPRTPTSLVRDLPRAVDGFVARALARQPDDRFPSAKALADALSAIADSPAAAARRAAAQHPDLATDASGDLAVTAELRNEPAARGARSGPTAVVVEAGTAVARDDATLPAGTAEPDPVSTTMPDRPVRKDETAPGGRRVLRGAAMIAGLAAVGAAAWLGLSPGSADTTAEPIQGAAASASDDLVPPAAPPTVEPALSAVPGASTAEPAASTAGASEPPPGATTTSAGAPSSAAAAAGAPAVPSTSTTAAASTAAPAAQGVPAGSTASPSPSGAPARTAAPTARPDATTSPAKPAASTATTAPTTSPPAYDPVFGLPAPTKP